MKFKETPFKGLIELEPRVFEDERGFFFESFHEEHLKEIGIGKPFVQDNQSFSTKGVLRGLHLQKAPYAQGKLVRVISGKVLDVVVDLRKNSATFGEHYKVVLDAKRHNMLYIPEGFAHGFVTLEDAMFFYKCTNFYNKDSETGIIWNDPALNIDWMLEKPIVSAKDQELPSFDEFKMKHLFDLVN